MKPKAPLVERAREFRAKPTRSEELLWLALRGRALGRRFYRQHPIGPFIADFACLRPRLVIEIDGVIHDQQRTADLERQRFIEAEGYAVLRFVDEDVEHEIGAVLDRIKVALERVQRGEAPEAPLRSAQRTERGSAEGAG
jgi:leucyl-tRNA synthetase